MHTPLAEDTPAVTDEEIWQECAERLRLCIEAEGNNRTKALEALEFLDGHQWPDDLYNRRKIARRPSLTINHTRTFRNRVVNAMRQQRPRIKVHPVGDGADVDKAELIGGLMRHIEVLSNADVAYDTAGSSAVDIGWGYARVATEYLTPMSMEQEIKILPIRNTFTVYMDPSSVMPAGEDAEWVILTEKMKRQEFKRRYPKEELIEFTRTGVGDFQSMWETKTEIRLAEYYRINKIKDELLLFSTGETLLASEYRKNKAAIDGAGITIVDRRPSYRKAIEWFRLTGKSIAERKAEGQQAPNGPLPGEHIPIARCEGNVLYINGQTRRKGMIEDLMDPARMFNYWRTAETEQLALASKAPWVGPAGFMKGHSEWQDANQTPYSALEYEPVLFDNGQGVLSPMPPPTRNPAIEIPAGFVQAAQSAQQDLMTVAGMPHEPGQDTPGSVVSGVALQRREALSDIGHYQYYDNQTKFIAFIGKICLAWMPVYYSKARLQRIIGEDGVPSMVDVSDAAAVGRYDIVMDTGPGYDTKRLESAQMMIDLLKITPLAEQVAKVGSDVVIRTFDFTGADDLADRLMPMSPEGLDKAMEGLPKRAQGIVKAIAAHNQQLQKVIQEQGLEIKYKTTVEQGWMQVEREKTRAKMQDTQTNDNTKQLDTHVRAVTAVNVAEIKAGADLLGKHVDGSYAAKAAEKAAETAEKTIQ
jgi:Phage P22-like portal protein